MKKRILSVVFAMLLLAGCNNESKIETNLGNPGSYVEATATYDWMAGESPVPNRRMGIVRVGLSNIIHAVSATGVYYRVAEGNKTYIIYADNGSNQWVKLCGRPDCTHDNTDCNAYIPNCSKLSYYNGYLYAMLGDGSEQESKLIRMDPDGSNRVDVLDLLGFAKEKGGDFIRCDLITDGVCIFQTRRWVEVENNGNTSITGERMDYYIYRLDGSMEKPVLQQSSGVMYNCGDTVLSYSLDTKYGGDYGSYWSWNPKTEEQVYLTDHPGVPGYFDEHQGYYFKDGTIRRLNYADRDEEILVETGLEGAYVLLCFPECMVLASRTDGENADNMLYFYNWAFELVDTVELTYPHTIRPEWLIASETAERLILCDDTYTPRYYINKSELGTGNAKIHSFNLL